MYCRKYTISVICMDLDKNDENEKTSSPGSTPFVAFTHLSTPLQNAKGHNAKRLPLSSSIPVPFNLRPISSTGA